MSALARLALLLLAGYRRFVSPLFGAHCRYHPTCSEYAHQAIVSFGALRGGWMALKRVARCHPWAPGGVDHIPQRKAA